MTNEKDEEMEAPSSTSPGSDNGSDNDDVNVTSTGTTPSNSNKQLITTPTSTSTSTTSNSTTPNKKQRSGLITALIMGPPLLAKFGIVLLVKFLTDLVVFPLLFIFRFCKVAKNKVLSIFSFKSNNTTINGENKINGSVNGSSYDNR